MLPKPFTQFKFSYLFIAPLIFLTGVVVGNPNISYAATAPSTSKDVSLPAGEEVKIMQDREAAIQNAIASLKGENSKKQKSKKIDLGEGPAGLSRGESKFKWDKLFFWKNQEKKKENLIQTTSGVSPQKVKRKERVDVKTFFSRTKKSPAWKDVVRERNERLEQFPSLDPAQVKESITELKVELKRDFLSGKEHTLQDVIQRAIQVHLPVQIAHERVALSERRILKAFRDFFSDADVTYTNKDGTLTQGPYKHRSYRLSLRQPLFHGGVLWNTYKMEMASRDTAKRELEKTLSDLIAVTSKAYFEYERAWSVLKEKRELYERARKLKKLSDEKVKANLISEIEKLNADSLYSQVEYNLETARQDLELAKLELQRVLELDISDPIDIQPTVRLDSLPPLESMPSSELSPNSSRVDVELSPMVAPFTVEGKEVDRYIDLAYAYRSDLQVEASKLRAARLTHKISAGKLLPEADLIVELGNLAEWAEGTDLRFQGDLETTKPKMKNEWRIGTELSWNVLGNKLGYTFDHEQRAPSLSQFQGTGTSAEGPITSSKSITASLLDSLNSLADLKETKIAVLEQVVELEKTEREVIREVKEAYFNYNKALIQVASSEKRMKYRERLTRLTKHRLDNNEIQISEYLQSETDYNEERANLYKALTDFYSAKVNLNRAIGIRNYLQVESEQLENSSGTGN